MSIDKAIETIEIKGKEMSTINKHASTELKKATGFEGNPFDEAETKKYFSTYKTQPVIENNRLIGMKIDYKVSLSKPTPSRKSKKQSASSSGPKINYEF